MIRSLILTTGWYFSYKKEGHPPTASSFLIHYNKQKRAYLAPTLASLMKWRNLHA